MRHSPIACVRVPCVVAPSGMQSAARSIEAHSVQCDDIMNTVYAVLAARRTRTGSKLHATDAPSLEVRASMRSVTRLLRSIPCRFSRFRAMRMRRAGRTVRAEFCPKNARKFESLRTARVCVADDIGGDGTRLGRGEGGFNATAAAPELPGAPRWRSRRYGHWNGWCEAARGERNGCS